MPRYQITSPSGRRVTVEGPSAPTEAEAAEIFKAVEMQNPSPAKPRAAVPSDSKELASLFPTVGVEAGGTGARDIAASTIQGVGKDVTAIPAHFFNQLFLNYPKQLSQKAGVEYPSDTTSPAANIAARLAGLTGAVMSPIGKAIGAGGKLIPRLAKAFTAGAAYAPEGDDLLNPQQRAVQGLMAAGGGEILGGAVKGVKAILPTGLKERAAKKMGSAYNKAIQLLQPANKELENAALWEKPFQPIEVAVDNMEPAKSYQDIVGTFNRKQKAADIEASDLLTKWNRKEPGRDWLDRALKLKKEIQTAPYVDKEALKAVDDVITQAVDYANKNQGQMDRVALNKMKKEFQKLAQPLYEKERMGTLTGNESAKLRAFKQLGQGLREQVESGTAGDFIAKANKTQGGLIESAKDAAAQQAKSQKMAPETWGEKLKGLISHDPKRALLRVALKEGKPVEKATKAIVKLRGKAKSLEKRAESPTGQKIEKGLTSVSDFLRKLQKGGMKEAHAAEIPGSSTPPEGYIHDLTKDLSSPDASVREAARKKLAEIAKTKTTAPGNAAKGMTRLYRVEPKDFGDKGEWLKKHLTPEQYKAFVSERGRLFSDNLGDAADYGHGADHTNTFFVDVPSELAGKIKRVNKGGGKGAFEYLLPEEQVAAKKILADTQKGKSSAGKKLGALALAGTLGLGAMAPAAEAASAPDNTTLMRMVLGEAENETYKGKQMVAEVARRRFPTLGTKGIYGMNAVIEKDGKYYRKHSRTGKLMPISDKVVAEAQRAIKNSEKSNLTNNAMFWQSVDDLKKSKWNTNPMFKEVAKEGGHWFYTEYKKGKK